jgi:excisionase family DNA binding protein
MEEINYLSITQAAELAKVGRQAIFCAIKLGRLKAVKKGYFWRIDPNDLEAYRIMKYSRQHSKRNGEYIFSKEKGTWSVLHICKTISEALQRPYTTNRVYYLIRRGDVPAYKCGGAWVIKTQDAERLLEMEMQKFGQMKRKTA